MGEHGVRAATDEERRRSFTRALLGEVHALEALIERGGLEQGIVRAGAEQEMVLVAASGRPAPVGPELLAAIDDPRFTSELARFNLEANLPPVVLDGHFCRALERGLTEVVELADRTARTLGARVVLTGILPTVEEADLSSEQMAPEARYRELDRALSFHRGGPFQIFIRGVDELEAASDTVMLESANTSLQLHLQVEPDRFVDAYNFAQLVTPPLLASATGSPLLFGRRLWHETRVALFESSVDDRSRPELQRGQPGRVQFGERWLQGSVLELFRADATEHRVVLTCTTEDDPVGMVRRGDVPTLRALSLHNGTVWRWNRACYGVANGVAHLRIENRVLPAGPTVADEVANAALFYGLMQWHRDLGSRVAKLPFAKVKEGFTSVARHGLGARVWWLDGGPVEVRELLLRELLPIARDGLRQIGVPREDVHRHLGVVEDRVRSGRTASHFLLSTFERLSEDRASAHAAGALVRHMLAEGPLGRPVHHWSEPSTGAESAFAEQTARELMTTRLFTVRPDDVLELATSVMEWRHVRYVPVEDEAGRPLGIVSWKELAAWSSERLRTLQSAPSTPEGGGQERDAASAPTTCVRDVMGGLPPVASPDEPAPELARRLLGSPRGCALIVEGQRLVGIVTEHDVTRAARGMLTERPSP